MNYVDLEQMERSLAASPSRPDCAQEARSGFVSWGPFTMTHSGLSIAIVKAQGEGKEATERPISGAFEVSATPAIRMAEGGGAGFIGGMLTGDCITVT